ncbi:MAG: GNAT family N-acetyltransferase [Pseudonocardiaceae bacterium]
MYLSDQQTVSGLTVQAHSDPSDISRDWWDSLAHPSAYLRYDWLRARSNTIHGQPCFIGVSGTGGEAVLAVPAYLTDSSSHPGYDPVRLLTMDDLPDEDIQAEPGGPAALTGLRARLQSDGLGKSVVVGAPGRMGGVSYALHLSPQARRDALAAAAAELERQAAAASAGTICWLYLIEDADEVVDEVLREHHYTRVTVGADCHLPIRWGSFDEYLGGFTSRRRWKIRHELATAKEADVSIDLHGPEVLGPELAELELQWRRKYGRRAVLDETVADYQELRKHVGQALNVFVARQAGRAVGFMTFIEDGSVWWARFPGFDYSAGKLYLYFNLLFYHPIQVAMDRGITSISYSLGSYETKRSRGCLLRNLMAYVRAPADTELASHLEVIDRAQHRRFQRIGRMYTKQ